MAEHWAKKILTDSFFVSASSTLSRVISFFAVVIITRGLNLADYGAVVLSMTVTTPVHLISSLGLESVIIADMARFRGQQMFGHVKALIKQYAFYKIFLTLAAIAASWFFKSFLAERFGATINDFYYILTFWVAASIMYSIFDVILNAHERFKILSCADIVEVASKLFFIVLFWLLKIISIKWVLMAYVLSKALAGSVLFFGAVKTTLYLWKVKAAEEPVYRGIIFKHGKWEVFSQSIIQQIDTAIRPWVIKIFVGSEGVAIFSVARNIYSALIGMVPIKQIIFPLVARNLEDKDKNILIAQKMTKYSFIIYFVLAVAAFFVIKPFISMFFPLYETSILLFRILLIRMLIMAVGYGQPAFFYAYKEQKMMFLINWINIVSLFVTLPLAMMIFSLPGVYMEKIITLSIVYALREYYLRRKYHIVTWRFKSLFQIDNYDRLFFNKLLMRGRAMLRI